jgi:hypothetical protein
MPYKSNIKRTISYDGLELGPEELGEKGRERGHEAGDQDQHVGQGGGRLALVSIGTDSGGAFKFVKFKMIFMTLIIFIRIFL